MYIIFRVYSKLNYKKKYSVNVLVYVQLYIPPHTIETLKALYLYLISNFL